MTTQRYSEEFHGLSPEQSFEDELARQHLAVAQDANEIARAAAYAANDAAAAARWQARISMAALIIATLALVVSIVTPNEIESYLAAHPWQTWFSAH
jgi:hypothetical protein